MVTISDIEDEIASRIEALAPDDFRRTVRGKVASADNWHRNDIPLTAVADAESLKHLCFSVSVEDAPTVDDGQGILDGKIDLLCSVLIVFVYRIGATTQLADYKLASEAARRVVSAVMQPFGEALFIPRNAFRPGQIRDGAMPVEIRFQVHFELPI